MTQIPAALTSLIPRIGEATRSELSGFLSRLPSSDASLPLVDAAMAAIEGGKHMRGLCAMVGAAVAQGVDPADTDVDALAAALEIYQASALAHDDVIDHADTRRGRPTPHVRLAEVHRDCGWAGDAQDFGRSGAILLGDLLLSAADHVVTEACSTLDTGSAGRVLERFTLMHAEVALGQFLDVRAEQVPLDADDPDAVSLSDALAVVRLKSARYSVVHPTVLGMTSRGASPEQVATLERILEPWGTAFQLRDDDLGVFGEPERTGKPAGDDLLEGKRTVLLALTWRDAGPEGRAQLAHTLGRRDVDAAELGEVTGIVAHHGREAHELMISALVDRGRRALAEADLDAGARDLLWELATLLTRRSA